MAQYTACVKEGVCSEAHWDRCDRKKMPQSFQSLKRPVVCVSWQQARDFARWVNGDLPSESEWLYVAQGAGQGRAYPWGNEPDPSCERAIFRDETGPGCGYSRTWDVCARPSGHGINELCDLAGNVWEWTLDSGTAHKGKLRLPSYQEQGQASCIQSDCNESNVFRISRGGGWGSKSHLLSNTSRAAFKDQEYHSNLGFRPVRHSPP